MALKKRRNKWFVTGVEPYQVDGEWCTEYGPYESRAEADDDRRGVQRFLERFEREQNRRMHRRKPR